MATIPSVADYNISEDSLRIIELLDTLLERVNAVYESNGVPLPPRQYWMLGSEPAEDCEQVVVTFLQAYLGQPGDQAADAQNCNEPRTAVVTINVTRNHPVGESGRPVNPSRITEASKWGAVDAATLIFNLDTLVTPLDWGNLGAIATVAVAPPRGGVQTTTLNLSLAIP